MMIKYEIYHADNLEWLHEFSDKIKVNLIYIDPPFNTGKSFFRNGIGYSDKGDRINPILISKGKITSFGGYSEYLDGIYTRLLYSKEILDKYGSIFIHADYRAIHYIKVIADFIFGIDNFMNEIIWAYDYGGRPKKYWPRKHDNILWYVKNKKHYTFNYNEMDRIPYMAPGLVGKEKAAKGKTPTDVWWHTIVPTNSKEKTGYPTQKPLGILERIVRVHSNPGDTLLDFYAGSGSFGEAALKHGRNVILVDNNPQAIEIMKRRLSKYG